MTLLTLLRRSLRFHARSHVGVVLGAAIGSAALTGALLVGDSVRESLRERALAKLGWVDLALASNDRLFAQKLVAVYRGTAFPRAACALRLPATATSGDSAARANNVNLVGIDAAFALSNTPLVQLSSNGVVLNEALARQLHVQPGSEIVLRSRQPSALSQELPVAPRNEGALAMRVRVDGIVGAADMGDFALTANQAAPFNAFMRLDELSERAGLPGKANLLLLGAPQRGPEQNWDETTASQEQLLQTTNLSDWGITLHALDHSAGLELRSDRVFLEPELLRAANAVASNPIDIVTYLANLIRDGTNETPYSMVAAAGPPYTPANMKEDEIILSRWLADDLHAQPGDSLELSWFAPDSGPNLREATNRFKVHAVVPLEAPWADRTLMPDFPGIQKAESTRDWDAGFPLVYQIRPQDEAYWKQYRGTPKAFVTLAAGQKMWGNRFGNVTAIRFPAKAGADLADFRRSLEPKLIQSIHPPAIGLTFEPVRRRALAAASQSQDFGQLFIGFSFFLVVAALLLMALLFQFGLEQRASEVGILLAVGWRPKQVRRILLLEAGALALLGGVLGMLGGIGYARAMIWGLTTIWRNAVGASVLGFRFTGMSLVIGALAGLLVAFLTLWLTLRKQARQPARELLAGETPERGAGGGKRSAWLAGAGAIGALALAAQALARGDSSDAGAFFGAGSLLLAAGVAAISAWMARLRSVGSFHRLTLLRLGVRGCARRGKRSLATIALLACGCFVILAIGVFRLDANRDATRPGSGTGGFVLIGQSTLPVVQDLNTPAGRDFFGLNAEDMEGVRILPFRVHEGDDASCLNLNRAQKPRLLGVRPELLAERKAFTFEKTLRDSGPRNPWLLLDPLLNGNANTASSGAGGGINEASIPAIGDANSIQWALGKKLGDTLDYTDEQGRPFKILLAAAVANSILQGNLVIDEREFQRRFPGESGYRLFLIDAPTARVKQVSATLSRALRDAGLELIPAKDRLNEFNAVQNTYLGTFQVLGGLGLLLGSAGLGVLVLRNVLERRGELALLVAAGFRRSRLRQLVLGEHAVLLGLGLGVGLVAAAVAVLPAIVTPGNPLPYGSLAWTLGAVVLNGLVWAWVATRVALRGDLLEALRNE